MGGDVPACLRPPDPQQVQTPATPLSTSQTHPQHHPPTTDVIVFHKNACGLTNKDRIEELLLELDGPHWDFVTLHEIVRHTKEEFWTTRGGHIFLGSGRTSNSRGVAVLVNKKWSKHTSKLHPITERFAASEFDETRHTFLILDTTAPTFNRCTTH